MTGKRVRNPLGASTRCTAISKRSGKPCANWALVGGTKCRMHIGKSVADHQESARMRLLEAVDPAAAVLIRLALNVDGNVPHHIQLAAARDILDRNGIGNTKQVEVLLKPWEQDIEGVLVGDDDGDDEVVDGEIVEDDDRELPPSIYESDDRLPSLLHDPPAHQRPGPRLR